MRTIAVLFFVLFAVAWAGCGDSPTMAEPESALAVRTDFSAFEKAAAEYKAYRIPGPEVVKYFIMSADQYGIEVRDISTDGQDWFGFVKGDPAQWPPFGAAVEMAFGCREI